MPDEVEPDTPEADVEETLEAPPVSITHIVGLNIQVHEKFLRQRCAWCGHILVEYTDTGSPGILLPDGTQAHGPVIFPPGALLREEQGKMSVIQGPLPDDFCGSFDVGLPG